MALTKAHNRMIEGAPANVLDFGAVGNGVTDDTAAIQAAIATGKKILFPYKQTFKVAGNSDIIFNNGADFNSCTLDVSSYNHDIYLNSGNNWVNYNSTSNVVTELQSTSTITDIYWSGWLNTTEVNESFVKVNMNQPYYRYRDNIVNRQDFNVVTRWGQVLSTPPYTLTTSTVTSVNVLSINKRVTTYSDVIIKVGSNDTNSSFLRTWNSTRVRLVNVAFDVDPTHVSANVNQIYYSIRDSYDIEVDSLHCSFPSHSTQGSGYTYSLSIEGCYAVRIKKAIDQGDGWGATGSNLSQRVLFEDCDLNRIDFHQPVLEYLKVHNCRVGSWGILVSTIGDLEVTSSSFNTSSAAYVINKGIIRSRNDTGGFCTGNLLVRDCIIDSDSQSYPVTLCTGDATQTPPTGSPLEYYFWKSELYENLESIGATIRVGGAEGLPSFMRASRQVVMNNIKGNFQHNGGISSGKGAFDLTGTDVIENTANRLVTIKNSRMFFLNCVDSSSTFIYKYFIENAYFDENEGTELEIVARGIFDIANSELEGLDCYSGGAISTQAFITIRDSVIRHTQKFNTRCFNTVDASVVSFSLVNNKLLLVNSADMVGSNGMGSAFLSNNDVYFNGTYITDYIISSSSTFTLPTGFNPKNKVLLVTGLSSNNSEKYTECRLPTSLDHSTVTSIDGTNYVTITASSSNVNNITITTGSAPYGSTRINFN